MQTNQSSTRYSQGLQRKVRERTMKYGFPDAILDDIVETQFGAALEFCGTDGANAYVLRGLVDGSFNSYLSWLKVIERDVLLFQAMKIAHINCPCCGEEVEIAIPKIKFHIGLRMASRPFVRCPKCVEPLIMFIGVALTPECIVDERG
jgi:hypothetical protein